MSGLKAFVLVAIVVLLALSNQVRPLNVLAYSLVGATVVAFAWSFASVRGLSVKRDLRQSRGQVGETVEERITIRNRTVLPRLWLEVRDFSTLEDHSPGRVIDLGPSGARTWLVKTVCQRRGEYFVGPTEIESADPLGIFPRRRWLPDARRLIVYPRVVELRDFVLPLARQVGGIRQQTGRFQTTPHAAEVREYYPGDPLNRIHWLSTARAGKLMVKEFDLTPTADVWLFLDLEGDVQRGEGDESTEEYAVTIAASLAKRLLDQGRSVGLLAAGARPHLLQADRSDRQYMRVLEELATARADGETPLAELIVGEGYHCGRDTVALVITPSLDEAWVDALQRLKLDGVGTAAILLERETFGEADAAPGEPSSLLQIGALAAAGIPSYLVKQGDAIGEALAGDGVRVLR